jgi:uncharacterized protein YutE (UPF0331/DUF86 family)
MADIRRCLTRVRKEYHADPGRLDDFTFHDAIILNILRSCEAAIDLAMHLVEERRPGVPQSIRDAFATLEAADLLTAECAAAMMRMCGFRNIAVHNDQEMELAILRSILESRLADFESYVDELNAEQTPCSASRDSLTAGILAPMPPGEFADCVDCRGKRCQPAAACRQMIYVLKRRG